MKIIKVPSINSLRHALVMSLPYKKKCVVSSLFFPEDYITLKVLIYSDFPGWLQYNIILLFSIKQIIMSKLNVILLSLLGILRNKLMNWKTKDLFVYNVPPKYGHLKNTKTLHSIK